MTEAATEVAHTPGGAVLLDGRLLATASQAQVEDAVAGLAADPEAHGIFVQLPLPDGLEAEPVLDILSPDKDVDGLTQASLGRLVRGRSGHVPCTPKGVLRLLERYETPAAAVTHSKTPDLAEVTREADIVIAATGSLGFITSEHVRPGARAKRVNQSMASIPWRAPATRGQT
jgi:methylenetetrahydrofolate dehydrogenase (NADP+)/methenyltetrahydrofolate cyclohydrolase